MVSRRLDRRLGLPYNSDIAALTSDNAALPGSDGAAVRRCDGATVRRCDGGTERLRNDSVSTYCSHPMSPSTSTSTSPMLDLGIFAGLCDYAILIS
jgi:hypothetical protein